MLIALYFKTKEKCHVAKAYIYTSTNICEHMKDAHILYMYAETNYETCHVSNQFTHTDYHAKVHNV